MAYWAQHDLTFRGISEEGGSHAIASTYGIPAYPTYILIAPNHDIVVQDIWPISNAQTFISVFQSNGLSQSTCEPLAAAFEADEVVVCEGNAVNFTDLSEGVPITWEWTFEGGNPATSTEVNPIVTYANAGEYGVTLSVHDGVATTTHSVPDFMSVFPLPVVTFDPLDTTCHNYSPFPLTGGDPPGGHYEGPGVSNDMFDPAAAGLGSHTITYYYTEDDCEASADQDIVVDICAGIGENVDNKFDIYPNPSSGDFTLKIDHEGKVSIVVYDLMGKIIFDGEIMANGKEKLKMNLNGNVNGLYLVSITTDKKTYVEKIRIVN